MNNIIGIDIGGTKCAVIFGRCSEDGAINILDKIAFPTEVEKGYEFTVTQIFKSIDNILERNNLDIKSVKSMGVSCGGPLDSKKGMIMSPPNLIGWNDVHITQLLEKKYGVRTKLQNDANACALAEWKFGAAKGYENVIFLTFGTGLGAGLIINGRLYSGTNDMAGEVGHIRLENFGPVGYGKSGSFEGFCSGGGIVQLAKIKILERFQVGEKVSFCEGMENLDALNAKMIADAAEAGDALAKDIYHISGSYLGKGLSILIDILNPEIIVIGSIFLRSRELLYKSAMEMVNTETLSHSRKVCRIVPAGLGEKIGDFAALAVAINELA